MELCNEDLKKLLTNDVCENLIIEKLKTNEFKLINTIIKPLSDTPQGFSGTHFFLQFEIITKNEQKVIVKYFLKLKFDPKDVKLYSEDNSDIYACESNFLQLATVHYKAEWAPKFYGYIGNRLLILEDLSERGFQLQHGQFDLNHCFVALQTLAKFHAFYFQFIHDKKQLDSNYSILKEHPELFKEIVMQMDTEFGREMYIAVKESLDYIIGEIPTSNSKIKSKVQEKFHDLYEYLKPIDNKYNVISHGDLWSNNFMFSNENGCPKKCCLIDYQLLRFLPVAHDVLTFLYLNTTTEFRRKNNLNQIFDYYYQQFSDELNKIGLDSNVIYPEDMFKTSINDSIIPVLLLNCMCKPYTLMDRNQLAKYAAESPDDVWTNSRNKIIKHEFNSDEKYKQAVFTEFQLLIDEIVKLL